MAEAKEVEYAATLASVREAHDRIRPFVNLTPVMTSSTMDRLSGLELFFKCKHGIERAPAPSSPVHLRTQHNATTALPIEAHTRVAVSSRPAQMRSMCYRRAAFRNTQRSYTHSRHLQ